VADRVELRGQLPPAAATAAARGASLFVLPSIDEAFGVAYVEAMAGGVPAIGCRGEDGPEEIAAAGGGIVLVPAGDVEALAAEIDGVLSDPERRAALGREAAATVRAAFTWEQCGSETLAAYRDVINGVSTARGLGITGIEVFRTWPGAPRAFLHLNAALVLVGGRPPRSRAPASSAASSRRWRRYPGPPSATAAALL
jgi:hypothetical protein